MSKVLSLVACVFGLGFAVNAATPVAIWEGNFTKPISGFTLDLNGNAVSGDGIVTIGNAGGIKIGFSEKMPNGITVMVRYVNLRTSQNQALMTLKATQDGAAYANFVGLRLSENNWTQGLWLGEPWGDPAYPFSATAGTLVLTYYHTDGTYAYHLANGVRWPLYGSTGLKGKDGHPEGVNIGGKDSGLPATGMQIAGIALFDSVLGESEMTDQKWTMPLNLGWNGSAWTNAVGTVVAPTTEHTLVMRDGDVIVFSSVTTPTAVQLPEEGHVTISGQDNLQGVTIDIPNGCTLEMTSNADLGANGVTGNGTLAYNPGANVNQATISAGKLANFTGTFWMKSGRHAYANAIASNVTLKVTDGAQLWPTGGTWGNVFRLSGQGWVNPEGEFQNDIEHAAMRLDAGVTLSADAWLLFVKGEDGKTPTIGTIAENGVSIASHLMGVDGFEKRGSGQITLTAPKAQAADLTGECTVATGTLQIGSGSGCSAGDTVKVGSGITVAGGAALDIACWTETVTTAGVADKVMIANDITISGGGKLVTADGAYAFTGKVTANDGASGTFNARDSWAFSNLVIPADATFNATLAGDNNFNVLFSVLGGDVKGKLNVTNEGEDRLLHHYELRIGIAGTALADGTLHVNSAEQFAYVVAVGDAALGQVTGAVQAAFGDGVATRNLTLTSTSTSPSTSYNITFKGVDKGTEQFDKLNLVIDGDVTLNGKGTSSACSGTLTLLDGASLKFVDFTALPSGAISGSGRITCTDATGIVNLPAGRWAADWTGTLVLGGCGEVAAADWDIASYYNGTNSVFEFGVVREGSAISYDKVTGGGLKATASPVELGELKMTGKITLDSTPTTYTFTALSGTRTLTINGAVALGRGRSPSGPSTPVLSFGDVSDFTGEIRCPDGAIHLVGEVLFGNATLVATNGVIVHSNAVVRLVDATAEKQRIMKVQGCTTTFEEGSALVMDNRYCQFVSDSPVVVDETVTIPLTLNDTANIDKPLMTWSERPLGYFKLVTDVPVEPGQRVYAAQKEPYGLIIVESVYLTFGGTVMPFEEQWLKDAGVWVEESVEETQRNLDLSNENGISPSLAYMLGFAAEDAAGAQYALTITSLTPSTSSLHLITLTIPTADARRNGLRVVNTLEATPDVRDWENPRIIELKTATSFLDDRKVTGAPQQFYRAHGQIIL